MKITDSEKTEPFSFIATNLNKTSMADIYRKWLFFLIIVVKIP